MKQSSVLLAGGLLILVVAIVAILLLTESFTPENTDPAFAAAVSFVNAAGKGDDATAISLLSPELQTYVAEQCPDGSVSACVRDYTPAEWGSFLNAVFRRAAPDGPAARDVELIATYEQDKGFSGVCIYNRVEQDAAGAWKVTEWAGFVHCGEDAARDMATNPNTPNRVP
jgi:hypothetical protein